MLPPGQPLWRATRMDFKQHLNIRIGLEQRLVMTAQLQQAIRLLQLSRTELVENIAEALETNPVLEEVPPADMPGESSSAITAGEGQVTDFEAPAEPPQRTEIDWQDYFTDLARSPSEGTGSYRDTDEERPGYAQTLTRASTLPEHLTEQLSTAGLTDQQMEIAEQIVGNLDDDGYFRPGSLQLRRVPDGLRKVLLQQAKIEDVEVTEDKGGLTLYWLGDLEIDRWMRQAELAGCDAEPYYANSLQLIADNCGATVSDVQAVLRIIQTLDPLGVATRDLRQCLMVQAEVLFADNVMLRRLVELHLARIEERDFAAIRRDLRCSSEELEACIGVLRSLEPRPGRRFTGETARSITPDVTVVKVGDRYEVVLNEDGLPKLRIAGYYQSALENNGQGDAQQAQAKEYLQEKLRAATWMIRSIHQRQSTIHKVTKAIMDFQQPFLDGGVDKLKPLVLREVAEIVGLHESTVSRVTTNKYVDTPQGIYELKFFFGARIASQGMGEDMAAEAVRQAIKRLIEKELSTAPLSDQEIAEILQGEWDRGRMLARIAGTEGQVDALRPLVPMTIARRTVAKYREQLGLESSSRRRKSF